MFQRLSIALGLIASLLFLNGCDVPRGAPIQSEIVPKTKPEKSDFSFYAVNKDLVAKITKWPMTGAVRSNGWIARRRGPKTAIISAGDRLNLFIWDSEQNSLLTAPDQKIVNINHVQVSPDGTIFVPYLDRIHVAGLSPVAARATIETALNRIITSAQVQLTRVSGRQNSVDMVAGAIKPGNYALPDQDFTILNLLSKAGGVPTTLRNPQVRLMRGSKIYVNSIANLYAAPALDTTLKGGDKVIVAEDMRYFLSLGATKKETLVYFTKDHLSALDALSLIGGILETRADPKGILVLREYRKRDVAQDGHGPSKQRVIFSLDLTTSDGLFSARAFGINPGDVVLATESPVNSVRAILDLMRSALGIRRQI